MIKCIICDPDEHGSVFICRRLLLTCGTFSLAPEGNHMHPTGDHSSISKLDIQVLIETSD